MARAIVLYARVMQRRLPLFFSGAGVVCLFTQGHWAVCRRCHGNFPRGVTDCRRTMRATTPAPGGKLKHAPSNTTFLTKYQQRTKKKKRACRQKKKHQPKKIKNKPNGDHSGKKKRKALVIVVVLLCGHWHMRARTHEPTHPLSPHERTKKKTASTHLHTRLDRGGKRRAKTQGVGGEKGVWR